VAFGFVNPSQTLLKKGVPINKSMDEENVVLTHSGVSLSHKEEWISYL
jgi:hypothetical protein